MWEAAKKQPLFYEVLERDSSDSSSSSTSENSSTEGGNSDTSSCGSDSDRDQRPRLGARPHNSSTGGSLSLSSSSSHFEIRTKKEFMLFYEEDTRSNAGSEAASTKGKKKIVKKVVKKKVAVKATSVVEGAASAGEVPGVSAIGTGAAVDLQATTVVKEGNTAPEQTGKMTTEGAVEVDPAEAAAAPKAKKKVVVKKVVKKKPAAVPSNDEEVQQVDKRATVALSLQAEEDGNKVSDAEEDTNRELTPMEKTLDNIWTAAEAQQHVEQKKLQQEVARQCKRRGLGPRQGAAVWSDIQEDLSKELYSAGGGADGDEGGSLLAVEDDFASPYHPLIVLKQEKAKRKKKIWGNMRSKIKLCANSLKAVDKMLDPCQQHIDPRMSDRDLRRRLLSMENCADLFANYKNFWVFFTKIYKALGCNALYTWRVVFGENLVLDFDTFSEGMERFFLDPYALKEQEKSQNRRKQMQADAAKGGASCVAASLLQGKSGNGALGKSINAMSMSRNVGNASRSPNAGNSP
ncbi:unnamed protein product, partial [Amoebophrya sp. A120]|eukprot:GSA120T00016501001.1